MSAYTVLTIVDDVAHSRAESAIGAVLPGADVLRIEAGLIRRLPQAVALIVADGDSARIARATGFTGSIVILADAESAEQRAAFRAQGTEFAGANGDSAGLSSAFSAAIPLAADGTPESVHSAIARTRQLHAAGEIAFKLQHDFNNPLSALLAEVQLLQMEAPNDDVEATAGRMLDLVRRLTALSRSLDGVRSPQSAGLI